MKKNVAHTVAFIGVMTALTFALLTLETYVFVMIIPVPPAIFTIPLFIALSMFGDWRHSFIGGTIFGSCSFILSFMLGITLFQNPLISILPRTLAGVGGFWMFKALNASFRVKQGKLAYVTCGIAAGLTVILHTVLVFTAMEIFNVQAAWKVIISVNFAAEFGCSIFLVPVYVFTMRRVTHYREKEQPKTACALDRVENQQEGSNQ